MLVVASRSFEWSNRTPRQLRSLLPWVTGGQASPEPHEKERFSLFSYGDKTLNCADCRQDFIFSGSEQQFYAERQFSEPRRCPTCRAARKAERGSSGGGFGGGASRGGGYSSGPREMFSATCSSCGREAQVPFRPSGAKPVYCSDCFQASRR
jgi:CxxC-x17-CxxC domain-containing protein